MEKYIIAVILLLMLVLIISWFSEKSAPINPDDSSHSDDNVDPINHGGSDHDSDDSDITPTPPTQDMFLCIGGVTDGIMSVREQPHGLCGGDMECPQGSCAGQTVPKCVDGNGRPSCPTCVDGKYTCQYYTGDTRVYPMQPTGATREAFPSFSAEFAECTNRGNSCKWGSMNSTGWMTSTGRGNSNPSKTTGYRIIGNRVAFHRDAGYDNSASFASASTFANNMDTNQYRVNNINDCEDKTAEPYTYDNIKYDGGYAYVYDVGGQCTVFRVGPGVGTSGTVKYVKN